MTDLHRLIEAAYHTERVASRKLAARSSIPEAAALQQVLESKAGTRGLAALLADRAAERSLAEQRRSAIQARRNEANAARKAARTADPAVWNAWFDGSARPNPGPCAIGGLITGPGGERIEISRPAGHGSSSEAEYLALLAVLEAACRSGAHGLVVHGDSRVVIDDLLQAEQDAAPSLAALRKEALRLAALTGARFTWIPRHRNAGADLLAQQGHR